MAETKQLHFEERMNHPLFFWVFNLGLMLIVFAAAELGHFLGMQGQVLAISVVWPATGFSLAALLLFGYQAWPGILLGNLAYNVLNLFLNSDSLVDLFVVAPIISLGSLAQALVSNYIIRKYASDDYFFTVKDVLIFLIPATLLACLIACTIGVTTLFLFGLIPGDLLFEMWITFWLGDTMGVYIFTPLLVLWLWNKPQLDFAKYQREALLIAAVFLILIYFTFYWSFPLQHLFLPLSLWATYYFRMHGATASIFFIALSWVTLTLFGYGIYNPQTYPEGLGILVSFLEVIVATSLIFAAVINEREDAWRFIEMQNQDLQQTVAIREEALKEMQSAIFLKKKLTDSLSLLTSGISKQLKEPLKRVNDFIKASTVCMDHLHQLVSPKVGRVIGPESIGLVNDNLKTLDGYLHNIAKFETYTDRVVRAILEQSQLIAPSNIEVKPVNLNILLNSCLEQSIAKAKEQYPNFTFEVETTFSSTVPDVLAMPESLTYAFTRLLDHSIQSLKIKKDELRASYFPRLEVATIDHPDTIEICIKDNAATLPLQQHLFGSFVDLEPEVTTPKLNPPPLFDTPEDSSFLDLALAHDVLVHVHHGIISVNYQENEYTEINIMFPKHAVKQR